MTRALWSHSQHSPQQPRSFAGTALACGVRRRGGFTGVWRPSAGKAAEVALLGRESLLGCSGVNGSDQSGMAPTTLRWNNTGVDDAAGLMGAQLGVVEFLRSR